MTLYHLTPARNLESILACGLIPAKGKGLTIQSKTKHTKVFLTNDIDRIAETQAGKDWLSRNNVVVLEISINDRDIEPHKYIDGATYTLSDFEFVCDRVDPSDIVRWFKYHKA